MRLRIYIICWFWIWITIASRKYTIVHSKDSIHWKSSRSTRTKSTLSNRMHSVDWKSMCRWWRWRVKRKRNWRSHFSVSIFTPSFGRKLKRLNLGGNQLTSVPQRALSIFDNLKKLEIQENKIRTIKEGDFEGKSLRWFRFVLNRLSASSPFVQLQAWRTWIRWYWHTINWAKCRRTYSVICHSWTH